jgi:hypothetical protein
MDEQQGVLKKRWDNVEHFPDLPNFPHHVHIDAEEHVELGQSMSIIELLTLIELELGSSRISFRGSSPIRTLISELSNDQLQK